MFFPGKKQLTTEFRITSTDGTVVQTSRLIAASTPDGRSWCVRPQTHIHDNEGGANGRDPFSPVARIRDAWNQYSDYTRTREDVLSVMDEFRLRYPDVSECYSLRGRRTLVPHPIFRRYPA